MCIALGAEVEASYEDLHLISATHSGEMSYLTNGILKMRQHGWRRCINF